MTSGLPENLKKTVQSALPPPVQQRTVIQLPEDMKVVTLVGIFGLLLLFALYFTKLIVMPIVFAFILYLMLQPGMRVFVRLHIPKFIGVLAIVSMLFSSLGMLGYTLVDPATSWGSPKRRRACRALSGASHQSRNLSPMFSRRRAKWE